MQLKERYEWLCNQYSDIQEHLPTFVQTVEELNAQKVVELGVRYGLSTIAWLHALKYTGGRLWAVDCSFPVEDPGLPESVKLLDPQGELGVQKHWAFILGDCHETIVKDCLPDEVDILLIDTNHVYEETLQELQMYLPKVRVGGRILLHDTAIEDTGNRGDRPKVSYPVLTAIKEFCEGRFVWTNVENCNGLGTIYV